MQAIVDTIQEALRGGQIAADCPGDDLSQLSFVQIVGNPCSHGKAIFVLFDNHKEPRFIAKVPRSDIAVACLDNAYRMFCMLSDQENRSLLPTVRFWGELGGQWVLIEDYLQGKPLVRVTDKQLRNRVMLGWLAAFYQQTQQLIHISSDKLDETIRGPIDRFLTYYDPPVALAKIGRKLVDRVTDIFGDRHLSMCASHGDLWSGNLYRGKNGLPSAVDWDFSKTLDLPFLDYLYFRVMDVYQHVAPRSRLQACGTLLGNIHDELRNDTTQSLSFLTVPEDIFHIIVDLFLIRMAVTQFDHCRNDIANGFVVFNEFLHNGCSFREKQRNEFWFQLTSKMLVESSAKTPGKASA